MFRDPEDKPILKLEDLPPEVLANMLAEAEANAAEAEANAVREREAGAPAGGAPAPPKVN
jgi:hypothetical protein